MPGWICYLLINILTLILFGVDKHAAAHGRWRIRESTLLGMCLIGGAVGGLAGMYLFHHKTRKRRFTVGIPLMIVLHILLFLLFTNLILK